MPRCTVAIYGTVIAQGVLKTIVVKQSKTRVQGSEKRYAD